METGYTLRSFFGVNEDTGVVSAVEGRRSSSTDPANKMWWVQSLGSSLSEGHQLFDTVDAANEAAWMLINRKIAYQKDILAQLEIQRGVLAAACGFPTDGL